MKVLMAAAIFGISCGIYGCSNEAKFAGMPMAAEELPVASPGATLQTAADANPSVVTTTGATITTTTGTTTVATMGTLPVVPSNWVDVTTVGPNLTLQDTLTGLSWSNRRPNVTWQGAIDHCNALTYNGVSGWRLPTKEELKNASDHGIITAARANWMTPANMQAYFWSASSYSDNTNNAWIVYLRYGNTAGNSTNDSSAVVCVRSAVVNQSAVIPPTAVNPPVAAPTNWVDVTTVGPNLTLQDTRTGLRWSNRRPDVTWQGAIDHCSALTYNGVSGWRLPTHEELMNAYAHEIKIAARANWMTLANMQAYFWSSSSNANYTNYAWFVLLANGFAGANYGATNKNDNYAVVCVQ